uniref:Ku domain-containing protein n=1 Tax=Timema cristinae TaxID=61476 RepID=A0A7R9CR88_TIMCR|nr:unnamed protein product [Timema cristinae]
MPVPTRLRVCHFLASLLFPHGKSYTINSTETTFSFPYIHPAETSPTSVSVPLPVFLSSYLSLSSSLSPSSSLSLSLTSSLSLVSPPLPSLALRLFSLCLNRRPSLSALIYSILALSEASAASLSRNLQWAGSLRISPTSLPCTSCWLGLLISSVRAHSSTTCSGVPTSPHSHRSVSTSPIFLKDSGVDKPSYQFHCSPSVSAIPSTEQILRLQMFQLRSNVECVCRHCPVGARKSQKDIPLYTSDSPSRHYVVQSVHPDARSIANNREKDHVVVCLYYPHGQVEPPPPNAYNLIHNPLSSPHHFLYMRREDSILINYEDALPQLTFYQKKSVRPTPWNVIMDIGSTIKIPVSGYRMISDGSSLPSWKKALIADQEARLVTEVSFFNDDENQSVVEKDNVIKAYHFGPTMIPFTVLIALAEVVAHFYLRWSQDKMIDSATQTEGLSDKIQSASSRHTKLEPERVPACPLRPADTLASGQHLQGSGRTGFPRDITHYHQSCPVNLLARVLEQDSILCSSHR